MKIAAALLLLLSCLPLSADDTLGIFDRRRARRARPSVEIPPQIIETQPEEKKPEPIGAKHYAIYDGKGNPSSLDALAERMASAGAVFLGEHHDDPIAHHLELVLWKLAHERAKKAGRPAALALEMFERDVQDIVDEYFSGIITEAHFKLSARPWKNYDKDYRPMVEYAREQKLPVLASNAPRRYVNRVSRLGAASLKDIAEPQRKGLPPLPYAEASPAYKAKLAALFKPKDDKKPATPDHGSGRGTEAQSLWDATMAWTVAEQLKKQPNALVVHVNGGFHSEQRLGIPEHLLRYRPGTNIVVVTIVPRKNFPKFDDELKDKGDFVIVTDESLPRSYESPPPAK